MSHELNFSFHYNELLNVHMIVLCFVRVWEGGGLGGIKLRIGPRFFFSKEGGKKESIE